MTPNPKSSPQVSIEVSTLSKLDSLEVLLKALSEFENSRKVVKPIGYPFSSISPPERLFHSSTTRLSKDKELILSQENAGVIKVTLNKDPKASALSKNGAT